MERKLISCFLMSIMFMCFVSMTALAVDVPAAPVSTVTLTDMPDGQNGVVMQRAVENGLFKGSDGKIMSEGLLTRAQMAAVITRAFGASGAGDLSAFIDVAGNGLYNEIAAAYKMGILKGTGNKMNPEQNITRQEVFVIIARALKLAPAATMEHIFKDAATVAEWAKGEINAMVNAGYIRGDGINLNLNKPITRMELAIVLDNVIKTYIRTAGNVTTLPEGNVLVNVPGVTLQNLTVKGDLIVGDGVGMGDCTLNNVKVMGRTIVRGGGVKSFRIMGDSQLGEVLISKTDDGGVRVVTSGGATVKMLFINDGKDDIIVEGTFNNMQVASDASVTLKNASVNTLIATAENVNITVDNTSKLNNFATSVPNSTLNVQGTVTNVAATKDAVGMKLNVWKEGTATNVVTAAPNSTLTNDGKVETFYATKDAVGAKLVVGEKSALGNIVLDDKKILTTSTTAAEAAVKAEAAAKEAAAKAAADKAAADKAAAAAKTDEAKAAAAAAQTAAAEAAAKAAADKAIAEKATEEAKAGVDKVTVDIAGKTEEKPVTPPTIIDNVITMPDPIKPTPPPVVDNNDPIYYMVNFNVQGGSPVNFQQIESGGLVMAPASEPTRDGYRFEGWYKEASCINAWQMSSDRVTGATMLYAKWTPIIEKKDIDAIINGGIFDVNTIIGEGLPAKPGKDYATLGALEGEKIAVFVKDGTVTVSEVYLDIIDTLRNALNTHSDLVAAITVNKVDLPLSTKITDLQIKDFVKKCGLYGEGGVGDPIAGSDKISVLLGQSLNVKVKDINNNLYDYSLTFKVFVNKATVDRIINGGIKDVNDVMLTVVGGTDKYASLSLLQDGKTTVTIIDGTVNVSKVYLDIIDTLRMALNSHATEVTNIMVNKVNLPLSTKITDLQIKEFVKKCGLYGEGGVNDPISGTDKIGVLHNQCFIAEVTDVNGIVYTYTIEFKNR